MKSIDAKLVVLGSQGVGKTSVVVRYVSNTFNGHLSPTIGASFFTCKMMVDNYRLRIQVWDTAGQERFRAMAPMYYRKSNAAILVYDITSLESFDDMKSWVQELQKNTDGDLAMCVFGNKCDLEDQREVDNNLALQFAASIGARHFQVSALSSEGLKLEKLI
ncbi:hypothetical protein CAPTEDRAFT_125280 [Capitella teleta]|uniref:Uncharacterized protein n=1 Tax=Capitella teleta TaxID=283909 RepID=R7TIA1_CAPTE|nr:hypothetical protein CAPTEDRAFT_125280 [Capitella teleta]|eukprot:ELT91271.1 hypothetical protein CAPTEDRAFT_125280 [Capitella teleta]